jgi:hypothetical protein
MSTDMHKNGHAAGPEPVHADVSFEGSDVSTRPIYFYFVVLTVAVVAAFVACVFVLRSTTNFASESYTPPPPSREMLEKRHETPTQMEPRLQGVPGNEMDPQRDRREKVATDLAANEKLDWVDKNAGIAQIPVKDAMKIIAEKGIPAVAAPTAEKKK